jgi:hypothetical protein
MMSCNAPQELCAVAEAMAKRGRPAQPRKKVDLLLADTTITIGSLVAKQFHLALLRAVSGAPSDTGIVMLVDDKATDAGERLDRAVSALQDRVSPEVRLWVAIIAHAMSDMIGPTNEARGSLEESAIRAEAHRYFWSRERHCLLSHCLLTGLRLSYVRELAGKAEDFVFEQTQVAMTEARAAGDTKPMTRGKRLEWLVAKIEASHATQPT